MSKREMQCPHADKISDCPKCTAELESIGTTVSNTDKADELEALIEKRVEIASTHTVSDDEVVQIAWLADGIELWRKSGGKFGHSPAKARRHIVSSVTRLIESEKQMMLDELQLLIASRAYEYKRLSGMDVVEWIESKRSKS